MIIFCLEDRFTKTINQGEDVGEEEVESHRDANIGDQEDNQSDEEDSGAED